MAQSFLFHADIAAPSPPGSPASLGSSAGFGSPKNKRDGIFGSVVGRKGCPAVLFACLRGSSDSREVGGIEPERLTVIPNGVDPEPFDRAEACPRHGIGVPETAFLTVFVGRLERQKGLPVLFEAAERMMRDCADWHLAIVGDGREAGALKTLCDARPVDSGRVHWLGRRDDVPSVLKSADLVVLPSLWEGMPNVVLEAMAARCAVVATAVEGSEELVEPGRTGWLVPPGDAIALAIALLDAAGDRERLARFGAAARRKIEAEHSPASMVACYEALWAGLLGLKTPS